MQIHPPSWANIPDCMRQYPQWVVAGADKVPYVVSSSGYYRASPVQGPWMTFEAACSAAQSSGMAIGFVLTEADPFTCIDLDIKDADSVDKWGEALPATKWTEPSMFGIYESIIDSFNSYTEVSSSCKGAHVWVEGDIGQGIHRASVEVYSRERFIICTGFAVGRIGFSRSADFRVSHIYSGEVQPIKPMQDLLTRMAADMRTYDRTVELEEIAPELTDEEIWRRASIADNSVKFVDLCSGDWAKYHYPSQSEADLSLMSMFTYYSKSNEQCKRMFRLTALGQRTKAIVNDRYLNNTLRIIRGRQAEAEQDELEVKINRDALTANLKAKMEAKQAEAAKATEAPTPAPAEAAPPVAKQVTSELAAKAVQEMQATKVEEQTQEVQAVAPPPKVSSGSIDWPPGLTGAIAGFIYNASYRPVKEVSIVAALGLIAGMTGKAFHVGRSGLNLYVILLARSAIGKEAMHTGISTIINQVRMGMPTIDTFVDYNDFASGPALMKACAEKQSFVNVAGEWGRKLKRLSNEDGREGPMQQLRSVMTNLYQKSGPDSTVGGISYSNKENNIASVNGIAYSMIGESTPGTFYDALTHSMMEDGFLSRFNIVEYTGMRPATNKNIQIEMPPELKDAIGNLANQALTLISRNQSQEVGFTPEAAQKLDEFDKACDAKINATTDESWRQMWNRAHLKVSRVAAALAAADCCVRPIITVEHFEWALSLILKDIAIMEKRIAEGDVGMGDDARDKKVLTLLQDFAAGNVPPSYRVPEEMVKELAIPMRYLSARTSQVSAFTQARQGPRHALEMVVRSMVDSGYITELPKSEVSARFKSSGKVFQIVSLPD